jgi:hypothetical protein
VMSTFCSSLGTTCWVFSREWNIIRMRWAQARDSAAHDLNSSTSAWGQRRDTDR